MVTEKGGRRRRTETLIERILDAIPYDGWVSAAEIAAQVGVSPQKVAGLIRYHIPLACIEKRSARRYESGRYLYRRLKRVGGRGRDEAS